MAGKYFEQFEVGQTFVHEIRRTVTDMDNILFSALTYNPAAIQRKADLIRSFLGKGYSLYDATRMANQALEGTIVRQTLLVTYDNLYLTIGVFVLCCIPIVYLQKFKRNVAMPVDAH